MSRPSAKAKQGEGERERMARRLLRRLVDADAALWPQGNGFALGGEGSEDFSSARSTVQAGLVEYCLRQDWLERHGSSLVLSAAGRSWLRRPEESADAYREQHQLRATSDKEVNGARRPVLVNETESPLGWLKSRKDRNGRPLLSETQYQAGERLRADYWFARMSARVTTNWAALASRDRSRRSAPHDPAAFSDDVLAAKERVMRALDAVGPELASVLVDVCCELKGLEEAEKAQGWPQRAGKVVLQIALTRLARHYGLTGAAAQGEGKARRLRHWGATDYRPTLEAWKGDQ